MNRGRETIINSGPIKIGHGTRRKKITPFYCFVSHDLLPNRKFRSLQLQNGIVPTFHHKEWNVNRYSYNR